jgi:type VI secretion system protein ImpB
MSRLKPGLNIRVENTLATDNTEMAVQLQFNKLEDFEPENIVAQVPALKDLLETRNKLRDLLTKSDRSEALENILEKTLQDQTALKKLAGELGLISK